MSQRIEVVSHRGFRYPTNTSAIMILFWLKDRNPGTMAGYTWAKVRVNNEDGSFFYVKRKSVT